MSTEKVNSHTTCPKCGSVPRRDTHPIQCEITTRWLCGSVDTTPFDQSKDCRIAELKRQLAEVKDPCSSAEVESVKYDSEGYLCYMVNGRFVRVTDLSGMQKQLAEVKEQLEFSEKMYGERMTDLDVVTEERDLLKARILMADACVDRMKAGGALVDVKRDAAIERAEAAEADNAALLDLIKTIDADNTVAEAHRSGGLFDETKLRISDAIAADHPGSAKLAELEAARKIMRGFLDHPGDDVVKAANEFIAGS